MPPRSLTRSFVDATKLMNRKKSSSFEVVWSSAVAQWLIRNSKDIPSKYIYKKRDSNSSSNFGEHK